MHKTVIASLLSLLSLHPVTAGMVVDNIEKAPALQEAGLRPGDEILEWTNGVGQTVNVRTFFDWMYLSLEIAPRGAVQLYINRAEKLEYLTVRQGPWDAEVHPKATEEILQLLQRLEINAREGKPREAILEASNLSGVDPDLRAWTLLRIGKALSTTRSPESTWDAHISALAQASTPFSRGVIWDLAGSLYEELGDFQRAEKAYQSAISEYKIFDSRSLSYARSLYKLGRSLAKRGQLSSAEGFLEEALDIQEHIAPNSRPTAETLTELGTSLRERSQLDRATALLQRSLSIYEILSPSSIDTARLLSSLAGTAKARGNMEEAKQLLGRALEIIENTSPEGIVHAGLLANLGNIFFNEGDLIKALEYLELSRHLLEGLSPNSLRMATVLEGIGIIAEERGDLESADDLNREALRLRRSLAPESLDVANSLNIRGVISRARGRLDIARDAYLEALKIQERLDPNGLDTATTLNNLGSLVLSLSERDSAESYYHRALSIQMRIAPISSATARSLANLGGIAHVRKRRTEAEILFRQSLSILDKVAPGGLETASTLRRLGNLLMEAGELQNAKALYEEAATICRTLAPGGPEETKVLLALAKLSVASGAPDMADRYFMCAIQSFESQMTYFGGNPDDRADFRASQSELYGRAIEFYLEHGRTDLAFHILEGFRARSFLEMLSERDLMFSEVPVDLEATRRLIAKRYDVTQSRLARIGSAGNPQLIQRLTEELRSLRTEHQEALKKIRDSAPGLGAIQSPHPMTAREVFKQIDPGTVILSYLVNPSKSFVFILGVDGRVKAVELPIGRHESLLEEIERFREMIRGTAPRSRTGMFRAKALEASGQKLYNMLIAPAETEIEKGQHVVISPEASLHLLPWSALVRSASDNLNQRYFAEWRPFQIVQSATLYAQQTGARRSLRQSGFVSADKKVAAFGDPIFPRSLTGTTPEEIEDIRVRSAVERGLSFEQLPATRIEVAKIGDLFSAPSLFLGEEASEENAKALTRDIQMVHFATHSMLDESTPLNSALVLSIPEKFDQERENGLLQAWEIFEHVRLDADLVVLSACETGLGKELSGEGLIGLTRAFQYAGARSVLASLWKISDRTTAELMVRFYKHLKAGKAKDEALRAAQIELIRGPIEITNEKGEVEKVDASAPYYWAAFQLYGDWQ